MTSSGAVRPMITTSVVGQLEGHDLEDVLRLVREAWEYDEEAGFTRIPEPLVRQPSDGRLAVRHVVIRGKLDDLTWTGVGGDLLAYVHLTVDDGSGMARVLVHPDFRSRGVATLTLETVGLGIGKAGWLDSGAETVRGWAYGHHPAAERLARRFDLLQLSRTWLQVRRLTGPHAGDLPVAPLPEWVSVDQLEGHVCDALEHDCAAVLAAGGLSGRAQQQVLGDLRAGSARGQLARTADGSPAGLVLVDDELGVFELRPSVTVRTLAVTKPLQGSGLGLALLAAALESARDRGAQVAQVRIDPTDERAVRLVRRLGFERNQDDALYGFGELDTEERVLPS